MKRFLTSIFATVALVTTLSAQALVINGSITDTDFLTTDSTTDTFYTDYFDLYVSADTTLEFSYLSLGQLQPWMIVVDNTLQPTPLLPAFDFEAPVDLYNSASTLFTGGNGNSGGLVAFVLNALAGVHYQVGLTSNTYFSLDMAASIGDYSFTITGANGGPTPNGLQFSQIPKTVAVPAPILLTGLGIVILAALRRRRIAQS